MYLLGIVLSSYHRKIDAPSQTFQGQLDVSAVDLDLRIMYSSCQMPAYYK